MFFASLVIQSGDPYYSQQILLALEIFTVWLLLPGHIRPAQLIKLRTPHAGTTKKSAHKFVFATQKCA